MDGRLHGGGAGTPFMTGSQNLPEQSVEGTANSADSGKRIWGMVNDFIGNGLIRTANAEGTMGTTDTADDLLRRRRDPSTVTAASRIYSIDYYIKENGKKRYRIEKNNVEETMIMNEEGVQEKGYRVTLSVTGFAIDPYTQEEYSVPWYVSGTGKTEEGAIRDAYVRTDYVEELVDEMASEMPNIIYFQTQRVLNPEDDQKSIHERLTYFYETLDAFRWNVPDKVRIEFERFERQYNKYQAPGLSQEDINLYEDHMIELIKRIEEKTRHDVLKKEVQQELLNNGMYGDDQAGYHVSIQRMNRTTSTNANGVEEPVYTVKVKVNTIWNNFSDISIYDGAEYYNGDMFSTGTGGTKEEAIGNALTDVDKMVATAKQNASEFCTLIINLAGATQNKNNRNEALAVLCKELADKTSYMRPTLQYLFTDCKKAYDSGNMELAAKFAKLLHSVSQNDSIFMKVMITPSTPGNSLVLREEEKRRSDPLAYLDYGDIVEAYRNGYARFGFAKVRLIRRKDGKILEGYANTGYLTEAEYEEVREFVNKSK